MKNFMIRRVVISFILIISVCFNNIGVLANGDKENVLKGEAILHAWCWSFETIEKNMKEIADAGYGAVQVSPPQECRIKKDCEKCKKEGKTGCTCFKENWYNHYQPTNFKIGNFQLGTKEKFKNMCEAARKYNIKVIVDIVANHVASNLDLVSDDVKNIPDVFHTENKDLGANSNWSDRAAVTHWNLLSLRDLNTGNSNVQRMIMDYMDECLKLGASGFRYDAAKHIELPKKIDGESGSDFWPNITKHAADKGAIFQYGEVLQGDNTPFEAYSQYMNVTASNYGKKIRDAICDPKNLKLNQNLMYYEVGNVPDDKLVTWVESHDNYANEQGPHVDGASAWMTDDEIIVGWAIVAGRAAGVPLFFSRPVGGGGRNFDGSTKNPFTEQTKIGDKGSDLFKNRYIVAINKFRKQMKDQGEYLRSKDGNILLIERGKQGAVLINLSQTSEVKIETGLEEGTYVNAVTGREGAKVEGNTLYVDASNKVTILTKK